MKPIGSIYIHFLDRYHSERARHGNYHSAAAIRKEANLAFRMALMFSNKVILPCSSLSESRLCRSTIREFPEFNESGVIGLSSPDGSIAEHVDRKKLAYGAGSPPDLAEAYAHVRGSEMPAFHKKVGSTTRQLRNAWRGKLETAHLEEFLRDDAPATALTQLERLWPEIPDLLEGRAFVPDHVDKIFSDRQVPIRSSASAEIIEPAYIGSYAAQFGSVVSDLRTLNSPFNYGILGQPNLSFRELVQRLGRFGLDVGLGNASSAALWAVYRSDEWDALAATLFRGSGSSAELAQAVTGILGAMSAPLGRGPALLMGESYRSPPPAANGPPVAVEVPGTLAQGEGHNMPQPVRGHLFAAVFCAVEREFQALSHAIPPAGSTTGDRYVTVLPNGERVLVGRMRGMGNVNAAVEATKLIQSEEPRNIVLAGIAGGFPGGDRMLGDLLIADQVVAYELAKLKGDAVELRPQAYRASYELVEAAEAVARRGGWKSRLSVQPPEARPTGPDHHVGTTLSGEKVVAKSGFLEHFRAAWTTVTGVEMEAAGAMTAVHLSSSQPRFIMIKAICDNADEAKADGWQPYAADVAASFVAEMLISPEMNRTREAPTEHDPPASALSAVDRYAFLQAMHASWTPLATFFDIPSAERETFQAGDQPQAVWSWLKARGRLKDLPLALMAVGRKDMLVRWPQLVDRLAKDDD